MISKSLRFGSLSSGVLSEIGVLSGVLPRVLSRGALLAVHHTDNPREYSRSTPESTPICESTLESTPISESTPESGRFPEPGVYQSEVFMDVRVGRPCQNACFFPGFGGPGRGF